MNVRASLLNTLLRTWDGETQGFAGEPINFVAFFEKTM